MNAPMPCCEERDTLSRTAPLQPWEDTRGAVSEEADSLPPTHNMFQPDDPHGTPVGDAISPVRAKGNRPVFSLVYPPHAILVHLC